MKRIGNIYEQICDKENIKNSIYSASKGKRNHFYVKKVLKNIDFYVDEICKMLEEQTYETSPYKESEIVDNSSQKRRLVKKPRFYPDQIIHWCVISPLREYFMRRMYYYSCGSIPGRGTKRAGDAVKKWMQKDKKNTKYCLKLDIQKFYDSVNNNILKNKLRLFIKDEKCLQILDKIIDTSCGLPIGNYTSPWLSNFYLQELDFFIKHTLKVKYYVRYVDDLVLFGSNKKKLHRARAAIGKILQNIGLSVKCDWQLFSTTNRFVDFVGFRIYSTHTTIRRRNSLRIKRRAKKISKKYYINKHDAMSMISYFGFIKNSNSCTFYKKNIKNFFTLDDLKRVVKSFN